jgi:hypothetical protein
MPRAPFTNHSPISRHNWVGECPDNSAVIRIRLAQNIKERLCEAGHWTGRLAASQPQKSGIEFAQHTAQVQFRLASRLQTAVKQ